MSETNPFKIAQRQLDEATAILGLDPATHAFLREPMRQHSGADGRWQREGVPGIPGAVQ